MNEDIVVPALFFATITVCAIGIPLVRAYARRMELQVKQPPPALNDERLERIEQAIEAMAVEVERISEGQRFTTKLLADRSKEKENA